VKEIDFLLVVVCILKPTILEGSEVRISSIGRN